MTDFKGGWNRIRVCAGQEFYTVRGLPFTFRVEVELALKTNPTDFLLGKRDFQAAFDFMPLRGPGEISQLLRGPSYVFAVLNDKRMRL